MSKDISRGIADVPITLKEEDCFGLGSYVDGLAEYIKICETPMTIAVQGDWGCGKTSMLNMVMGVLGDSVKSIWINTWQYSKFHMDENLTLAFLARLSASLGEKNNKKTAEKLVEVAKVGVRGLSYIIDILGAQKLAEDIGDIGSIADSSDVDAVRVVEELKSDFQAAINEIYEREKKRVVIFIDDLDRLAPEKAVDLMEVLKLFLDCTNCIFVLAIDYEVVVRGIEDKYGKDFGKEQGKKFFDKIIQVPFIIPVEQYKITEYIKKSMPFMADKDFNDIGDYEFMILNSIGSNPRSMKRLFNTFLLLATINNNGNFEEDALAQKMLFAALCIQLSMEDTYRLLVENVDNITKEFLDNLDVDEKSILFISKIVGILSYGEERIDENALSKLRNALSISSRTNNERIQTNKRNDEIKENRELKRTVGSTEVKYKIITMGASMHIGFGTDITFIWKNKEYNAMMHKGIKGRIDRLAKFYADSGLKEGDEIRLEYNYDNKTIMCTIE